MTYSVTRKKLCKDFGFTKGQVRGKIQRGVWQRGVHYVVLDRCTHFFPEVIDEWIRSQASVQREAESKSGLSVKARTGRGKKRTAFRQVE